jgi:hypothetical protein
MRPVAYLATAAVLSLSAYAQAQKADRIFSHRAWTISRTSADTYVMFVGSNGTELGILQFWCRKSLILPNMRMGHVQTPATFVSSEKLLPATLYAPQQKPLRVPMLRGAEGAMFGDDSAALTLEVARALIKSVIIRKDALATLAIDGKAYTYPIDGFGVAWAKLMQACGEPEL